MIIIITIIILTFSPLNLFVVNVMCRELILNEDFREQQISVSEKVMELLTPPQGFTCTSPSTIAASTILSSL